ncbi:MAG: hypothetical protein CK529_04105 [Rhodospirillaceae bacterium]|nr:MAG: hypothetical protein CK529_04105 [Rhodospirillaceae bacterium]
MGGLAWAQSETATLSEAKAADQASGPDKKICRTSAITGSRIGKVRICKTAQEWASYEGRNQKDIDETIKFRGFTDPAAAAGGP